MIIYDDVDNVGDDDDDDDDDNDDDREQWDGQRLLITIMVFNYSNSKVVNVMSVYLVLSIFAPIFNEPHLVFL